MAITKTKPKTGSKTKSKTLSKTKSKTLSKSKTASKTKTGSKTLDKYRDLLMIKSSKTKSKYKHQITDKTITKQEYKIVSKYIDLCNKCDSTMVFNPKTNMCINRNSDEARKFDNVIRFCDNYFAKKLSPDDNKIMNFLLDLELPLIRLQNKPVTLKSLIPKEYLKHMNNTTAMLAASLLLKFMLEGIEIKKQLDFTKKILGLVRADAFTPMTDMLLNLLDNIRVFRGETSIIRLASAPFIGIFGFVSTLFIKQQQKDETKKSDKKQNVFYQQQNNASNFSVVQKKSIYIRTSKNLVSNDDGNFIGRFLDDHHAFTENNTNEIDLSRIGLKHDFFIKLDFKFGYDNSRETPYIFIRFYDDLLKTDMTISLSEDPNIKIPKMSLKLTKDYTKCEDKLKILNKELKEKQTLQKNNIEYLKIKFSISKNEEDKNQAIDDKDGKEMLKLDKELKLLKIQLTKYSTNNIYKKSKTKKFVDGKLQNPEQLTNFGINLTDLNNILKEINIMIKELDESNYIAYNFIIPRKIHIIQFFTKQNNKILLYQYKKEELLKRAYFTQTQENFKELVDNNSFVNTISNRPQNLITNSSFSNKSKSPTGSKVSSPSSIKINFSEIDENLEKIKTHIDVNDLEYSYEEEEKKYNKDKDNIKGKLKGKFFKELFFNKSFIYDKLNTEFVPKLKNLNI